MSTKLIYIALASMSALFIAPSFSNNSLSNTQTIITTSTKNGEAIKAMSDAKKRELTHLIKQDCGSCHGMLLKGGLGPALLPEDLKGKSTLFIQNTIMHGRPGTAMPPWKTLLTEQETLWISKQLQQGIAHD